jgi:hypothetical protein
LSRPRFLADEDFRFEIVTAVRRFEPSVEITTVVELGRSGSADAEILEFASDNGLLVVSHDVRTMRAEAQKRIADGRGDRGLFFHRPANPDASGGGINRIDLVSIRSRGVEESGRLLATLAER